MAKKPSHELPMGWRSVAVTKGLEAGTPIDEWNKKGKPQHPRQEIMRWVRGTRYVRICEEKHYEEIVDKKETRYAYALHIGRIDEKGDDYSDKWVMKSDKLESLEKEAKVLMRLGGTKR